MKKFRCKIFYRGCATEVVVCALRSVYAKRHVQTFFKECRVISVTEIKTISK